MKSFQRMVYRILYFDFLFMIIIFSSIISSIPLDGRAVSHHPLPSNKCKHPHNTVNEDNISDTDFSPVKVLCELNGFTVPAIIDTGAQITIISSSCAKRCRIANLIDTRYSGRAIGVGSSEILGRIDNLQLRVGPISFQSKVAVLRESSVDFLIGMDFLRRFKCDLCLTEGVLKLKVRDRAIRVPLISGRGQYLSSISHSHNDDNDDINVDVDISDHNVENEMKEEEDGSDGDHDLSNSYDNYNSSNNDHDDDHDDDHEDDDYESASYEQKSIESKPSRRGEINIYSMKSKPYATSNHLQIKKDTNNSKLSRSKVSMEGV